MFVFILFLFSFVNKIYIPTYFSSFTIIGFVIVIFLISFIILKNIKKNIKYTNYKKGFKDCYEKLKEEIFNEINNDPKFDKNTLKMILENFDLNRNPIEPKSDKSKFMVNKINDFKLRAKPKIEDKIFDNSKIKKKLKLRNINIMLYVSSFLFIAASTVFISTAAPSFAKMVGLMFATLIFYLAGIILYKKVSNLKSAAIAFIGTSLAIMPFNGIAMNILGGTSASFSWLLISAAGLVLYTLATVILQNQIISYMVMAFVLSLTQSVVMSANLPIIWYFIVLISISLIATMINIFKPKFLPKIFRKPLSYTGQIVTPIALMASMFLQEKASLYMYEIVFGLTALNYLVSWLQNRDVLHEMAYRVLLQITILISVWDLSKFNCKSLGMFLCLTSGLQILFKLQKKSLKFEKIWKILMLIIVALSNVLWLQDPLTIALNLTLLGVLSLYLTYKFRDINWSYILLIISGLLPFIIERWLIVPNLSWSLVSFTFFMMNLSIVIFYLIKNKNFNPKKNIFFKISNIFYLILIFLIGIFGLFSEIMGSELNASKYSFFFCALLLVLFSYVYKVHAFEIFGVFCLNISIFLALAKINLREWLFLISDIICFLLAILGTILHHKSKEHKRRDNLLIFGKITLTCLIVNNFLVEKSEVIKICLLIFLTASLISFVLTKTKLKENSILKISFSLSYFLYIFIALIFSFHLSNIWSILVYIILTILMWNASYSEKQPLLLLISNISIFAFTTELFIHTKLTNDWKNIFIPAFVTSIIIYSAYWVMFKKKDTQRSLICLYSTWFLNIISMLNANKKISAVMIILSSITVFIYGHLSKYQSVVEISIYLSTLGLQYLISLFFPNLNIVFYSHWWFAIFIIISDIFYKTQKQQKSIRLIFAISFVTLCVGKLSLEPSGEAYQNVFLIEQVTFLILGAIFHKQWIIYWGAAGATISVLYFLRAYTYLWLSFLGLIIMFFVIWKLRKINKK
ncbi:MAG: hypothetical protein RsTaC01_0996 [Candidatus Paraimprobicoccus trichonymphae]|uniref:Uncharacterized protein n=1 Tax=Candidatus Paraimprobicoccus trichonymphae TaxID=3033793 RepID=A0AA48I0G5_9FIRM|nr:MAG: hypothetical protein RsTaC01_0996 [Candidatus Paraimprobicoccus trichonymphae]